MPASNLVADEATTVAMITAFDTCSDACDAIERALIQATTSLFTTWGGVAAKKYGEAIENWKAGFNEVRQGLNMLNDSMVTYAHLTKSTEDNALMIGSSWAGDGPPMPPPPPGMKYTLLPFGEHAPAGTGGAWSSPGA
jgi:uncharacterized protein YukE